MIQPSNGIPTGNPPAHLTDMEYTKSRLLIEAHMLKAQHQFEAAANNFAQVAEMECRWADWAENEGFDQLMLIHRRSEISCWAQAGNPHRALTLVRDLLNAGKLSAAQREDLEAYRFSLQQQLVNWMEEWSAPMVSAD